MSRIEQSTRFRVRGKIAKKQAAVDWIDSRGRVVPVKKEEWVAFRGDTKKRFIGIRNVGTRELRHLVLMSWDEGATRTKFRHPGSHQRFFYRLRLGNLKPGKRVMFWIKEEATGWEGTSSNIFVTEA